MLKYRLLQLTVVYFCVSLYLAGAERLQVTDNLLADGSRLLTVTNVSSIPLTGVTVEMASNPPGIRSYLYYDSLISPHPALGPGESYTFHLGSGVSGDQFTRFVEVAVFSDGVAIGDPDGIRSLWSRRIWEVKAREMAFHDYDVALAANPEVDNVIATLTARAQEVSPPGLPKEQRDALRHAYSDLIGNIRRKPGSASATVNSMRQAIAERRHRLDAQIVPKEVSQP